MHPIEACIQNPVKVAVGVLLLALFGTVALFSMPMQLTPEVDTPSITIETRWPGASPQEIEQEIILEQEEYLKSVEGVVKMSSESADSLATIVMEFGVGANMQEALLKVNSNLQQVPEYPEDADEPVIRASSSSDQPIAWFILGARMPSPEQIKEFQAKHPDSKAALDEVLEAGNPGLSMLRLRRAQAANPAVAELLPKKIDISTMRKFVEDEIEPEFERVDGVSNSSVFGGRDPEMQVIVDPDKLAARGLTVQDVRLVLRAQNKDTSAGDLWDGKRRYVVRTLGQFRSEEEVAQQLLAVEDGRPIYVRDVATVKLGYRKPDGFVRRFGDFALACNCQRETGANVLDVMDGLRATAARLNATVLKDRGLEMQQVYDETDYIYSSVGLVNQNIILGGALTIMILMTFLHLGYRTMVFAPLILVSALAAMYVSPWLFVVTLALILGAGFWFARGALVVGLAIPISIIGTFLMLALMGRSLNVISLAGLSFAVGMLVDNAVVVLENIYRHYQNGETPYNAAYRAGREVWGAVFASTATTLAVFLPVIFVQEQAGQLFRDIALAISFAVGLSLIVSITVIPTLAARILPKRREQVGSILGNEDRTSAFTKGVVAINRWAMQGVLRRLAIVVGMVALAVMFTWMLRPKIEYLPNGNKNLVICLVFPPPGYNVDQLMALGQEVEDTLEPYWNIDPESPEAAELDYPPIADFFYVARGRQVFLGLRSTEPTRVGELITLIQSKFRPKTAEEIAALEAKGEKAPHLPGSFVVAFQSSLFERGLQGSRSIDIEISGPELETLVGMAGQMMGQISGAMPGSQAIIPNAQLRPIPSLDLSSPEVHVQPKLFEAAGMGISTTDLGYTINALVDGAYAADYYLNNDKIDLVIIGSDRSVEHTQDIASLPVAIPSGRVVPVGALANIDIRSGPEQINHRERERTITVQVTPPLDISLEESIRLIQDQIVTPLRTSGQLNNGYKVNLAGAADKLSDTWRALRLPVLLALLITYLLMAALFESWLYPFVIILTVPLGAVGGVLGLQLLSKYQFFLASVQGIAPPAPQTLDVLTMLGFVILIGTVVNNAILIVHQGLIYMREEGYDPESAILESVRTRIRPIFMTTTTTVFGLAPLVLFPGAGSELYCGLGSVLLGGLLVSTIFTLFLAPTLFSLSLEARAATVALLQRLSRSDEDRNFDAVPATAPAVIAEKNAAAPDAEDTHPSYPGTAPTIGNGHPLDDPSPVAPGHEEDELPINEKYHLRPTDLDSEEAADEHARRRPK
ncbi:efflux RND transporter permease subunit [Lignipirellula cremea]|uniref:Multidrug resistance protein MdtC n=1 Tax=Lignipirellula cremea TaxID=2528010 RepID=A0A518DMF8_9BACT|nr:efflux RND transporter permease subunit [Lignipirellula cremea]QDU93012.1 Multidrug resistance protein MdtC [Lignipirellula cremea]